MKRSTVFVLIVLSCTFAFVLAFPSTIEDEENYLQIARRIIQGRVVRNPQHDYYKLSPVFNQHFENGYPSHGAAQPQHNSGRRRIGHSFLTVP
ncbi:unnamed protein product [Orchesella dallaii]|uniref:Uncharacterized protein n=1 Tax=Orchesella dallaii TaxID=48710 RepID=A0ABP1RV16_9HEXA